MFSTSIMSIAIDAFAAIFLGMRQFQQIILSKNCCLGHSFASLSFIPLSKRLSVQRAHSQVSQLHERATRNNQKHCYRLPRAVAATNSPLLPF